MHPDVTWRRYANALPNHSRILLEASLAALDSNSNHSDIGQDIRDGEGALAGGDAPCFIGRRHELLARAISTIRR
jgi:hypothetical protein